MKRSLPLVAIAVLALLGPASVLAAPGSAATARYFEIRGLVLDGDRTEASGKLAIDGKELSASAGCNMIGGHVTQDGNVLTLVGPTYMTEMACPGAVGDAEAILIKILQLGTFTITDTGWVAAGGEIVTVELTSSGPGPVGPPPDEPVTSTPGTGVEPGPSDDPTASCPPVPSGTNSTIVDGGPAAGSGSGASGGGSTSSDGSTGTGGSSGSSDTSSPPDQGTAPGSKPGSEPGATPGIDVPPPPPNPAEESSPGPADPESSPGVILPDPIGQDPNVGKPAGEVCEGFATGGVVEDSTGLPKAVDMSAEHARGGSDPSIARIAVALGLLLIVVVAGFYRPSRVAVVEGPEPDPTTR